ncbi:MAG: InlB B-repeat-containing protein, partial [Oscillospiraceae bacterium]
IGGNYELITIDPNGGTVTGMVNFISGSNVVLPPASVLAGEVFGGWYDGTTIYQPGDKVAITQTVTYKAIWKYDVTYKAGTGANSGQADKTAIKYSGIDLALLGETYKKAKNIQSGWAISDGGKKAYDLKANYTTDGAIILYPVWSPAGDIDVPVDDYCTITPKSGAGGQITPGKRITVRSGESAGFSMAADKGYQIANVKVDGRSVGVTSQYIFTNIWSDHTIAVSFEKATPTPKPQPDPPIPDKPLRPDPAPDKTPGIITDKDDPGGNPDTQESRPFILLSALLALAAVLLAVLAVLKKCTKKRKLLAILGAVAAVLIFLVTTGWSGIAFANLWTLAVALAAVLPAFVFIAQRKEDEETGEDAPQ